jgi:hypothetical protein
MKGLRISARCWSQSVFGGLVVVARRAAVPCYFAGMDRLIVWRTEPVDLA